jgi:DnaJ-domain-containing protein 1
LCFSRFKSLHSGNFVKRIALRGPRNLDSYNLRVSCAAGKEEHGGRREKSGGKHVEVKDHYRVLGIRRQATIPAIKSAFRQLARQVQKSSSSSSSSFRPSTLVGFYDFI